MAGDRTLTADATVRAVSFSSDGSLLSGLCSDMKVRVWNFETGKLERDRTWKNDDKTILLGPAGRLLTVNPEGRVDAWNPQGDESLMQQAGPLPYKGGRLVVSPGVDLFASAKRIKPDAIDEAIHVWGDDGREVFSAPCGFGGIASAAFSPSGSALVVAGYDTNVRAWALRNGELVKLIEDIPVAMFATQFSPDGKLLALAGADRTIYVYDVALWKLVRRIEGQPEMIASLAWSTDSRRIVTGGFNVITEKHPVSVIVWEAASGKKIRTMPAPHVVRSVAFHPDGRTVAVAAGEKVINLWNVPL